MSDKIAVYIVSMGKTPEEVRAFVAAFSERFKIPREKLTALSARLPVKIGSYDLENAKRFGIEIRRMGGEVSLRRFVKEAPRPAAAVPAADEPADSWVVHGHSESQDDLRSMSSGAAAGTPAAEPPEGERPDDAYPGIFDGPAPVPEQPKRRMIGGKYEPKLQYTADQGFGLTDERFQKVKELYAGRKGKRPFTGSPAFRIMFLILVLAAAAILYMYREEIGTLMFGLKKAVLADAYEHRLPASVSVPADLTGSYAGTLEYTTRQGDAAVVDVTLFIEGKNVHDVVVVISSAAADIGDYRLKIEYAPGYIMYSKTVGDKVIYSVENSFPSSNNAVSRIDDRGKFSIVLEALDTGIDPNAIPESEKDHLGNMIFLKMEGAFAGDNRFYGGLLTSGSPLMGWEAAKR
jgi:hypothetical protein